MTYNLININPKLELTIQEEVGEASAESFTKLYDRRFRYGFNHVANLGKPVMNLCMKLLHAKIKHITVSLVLNQTQDMLTALWELDRFPYLVVLDPYMQKNNYTVCKSL